MTNWTKKRKKQGRRKRKMEMSWEMIKRNGKGSEEDWNKPRLKDKKKHLFEPFLWFGNLQQKQHPNPFLHFFSLRFNFLNRSIFSFCFIFLFNYFLILLPITSLPLMKCFIWFKKFNKVRLLSLKVSQPLYSGFY